MFNHKTMPPPPHDAPHARAAGRRTVEDWAAAKGHAAGTPDAWKFAAARAMHNWVQGAELTEAEYDAAVEAAGNVQLGS